MSQIGTSPSASQIGTSPSASQIETTPSGALTDEETKYVEDNQKSLQIAVDNCYLLFDPKHQQKPEDMFKFIESKPTDRLYIYLFITNTCEIVEGLTAEHIICICQLYKQMTEEQLQYFSKLIQDAFFASIDVKTSGSLQYIWTQLMDTCMTKINIARGINTDDTQEIQTPLPSDSVEQITTNEGIAQEPKPEIIITTEPVEP